MPPAIAAVASAAAAFLATTAFTVFGTAVTYGTILKYTVLAAGTIVSSSHARKQAKKAMRNSLNQGRTIMVREAASPREIVYGTVRKSGTLVFAHTTGATNEFLHLIVALAGHQVQAIGDIFLNDEIVSLDSGGVATSAPYTGLVRVTKFLGTDTQSADANLITEAPTIWTSAHRLRGIAYVYVRLKFNQDAFPGGIPNISAIVQGKLVLDTRTSTTAFSANWALCLRDYMSDVTLGLGVPAGEFDATALNAAANIADQDVPLDPSGTEKRYTLNGVVVTSATPGDVIEQMAAAGAGFVGYIGGKWIIHAGAYRTPTITLDESDLRGPLSVQTKVSRREIFNGVKGIFTSPQNQWQPADFPPVTNATYTTQDGGVRIWQDIELPFTTSNATAQRISKIALERVRQQIVVRMPCKLTALRVQAGDNVMVTNARLGWSSKVFEVQSFSFVPEPQGDGAVALGVDLLLRETAAGVWDWNDGEETTIDLAPNTDLPNPFAVAAPTSLVLTSGAATKFLQPDGTTIPRLKASWTIPADEFVLSGGLVRVQYKTDAASIWSDWSVVTGTQTEEYITDVLIGTAYSVRIRSENTSGVASAYTTVTGHTVLGDTNAPATSSGLTATAGTGKAITLSWTQNTEADLSEYGIYRNTTNNPATATKIAEVSSNRFVDVLVDYGILYYYWVTAFDRSENESAKSTVASATASEISSGDIDTAITSDINTALANSSTAIADAATAQSTANSKITTFIQGTPPTALTIGDLWVDTSDDNKLRRWDGSIWADARDTGIGAALSDAANAQATADGKIITFIQGTSPTAAAVGDLWVDNTDSNRLYRWNGTSWADVQGIRSNIPATPAAVTFNSDGVYLAGDGSVFAFIIVNLPAMPTDGVDLMVLYRVDGSTSWIVGDFRKTGGGTARLDDLTPGITYNFATQAISNFAVLSDSSTPLSRTAPNKTTAPATPSGLTATGTLESITLAWSANTESDFREYLIFRNTSDSIPGSPIARALTTEFIDTDVAASTTYYYWLKAVNRSGVQSSETASVNAQRAEQSGGTGFLLDASGSVPPSNPLIANGSSSVAISGSLTGLDDLRRHELSFFVTCGIGSPEDVDSGTITIKRGGSSIGSVAIGILTQGASGQFDLTVNDVIPAGSQSYTVEIEGFSTGNTAEYFYTGYLKIF